MNTILEFLSAIYLDVKSVDTFIGVMLGVFLSYKTAYKVLGLFVTRKFKRAKKKHKYAILIAARNEEEVIGNLLDSIKKQDYDKKKLTVFVVADNCTDKTAEVSRKYGANVYERFNDTDKTKGFALQFLFKNIEKDYGTMNFEGYFIFDADNLLKKDFISRMNDAFDSGEKIITSYRNTKNFNDNWIAANYGLHWIRSIRTNHRPRSFLRLATNIQGTGFLFSNEIVKDGWKYTSLTEDRALTADAVAQGYQISYNNEAEFFDEQPVSLKIALRQRLRWSRGHLEAFVETGPKLLSNVIFGKFFLKNKWDENYHKPKDGSKIKVLFFKFVESIRHRFASFDTLMQVTPTSVIYTGKWIITSVIFYSCFCYTNGVEAVNFFAGGTYLAQFIRSFTNVQINVSAGVSALIMGALIQIWLRIFYRIGAYLQNIFLSIYLFFIERRRLVKIPFRKKVIYCLTWPIFDIIGRYTTYIAIFKKVTWQPIPHTSTVNIDDLKK